MSTVCIEDGGRNAHDALPSVQSLCKSQRKPGVATWFASKEYPGTSVQRTDLPPPTVMGTVPGHVPGKLGEQVRILVLMRNQQRVDADVSVQESSAGNVRWSIINRSQCSSREEIPGTQLEPP